MNRLILCLGLVASAYAGHAPNSLQTKQEAPAGFAEVGLRPLPEPQSSAIQTVALRSPTTMNDAKSTSPTRADNQIGKQTAPQQSTSDKSEPSLPLEEEADWVAVIRGATVHSGPSVSAPIVRYYAAGTELHLIGYKQGWFQVSDPRTSHEGWIYEKYYLQVVLGPGQAIAMVTNAPSPKETAFEELKPSPPVRRVKKPKPQMSEKVRPRIEQPRIASARIQNESVASLVERALRR